MGDALVTHPLVRKVSFTGSTEIGRRIMELASRDLKRISLELGGKSPEHRVRRCGLAARRRDARP